MMHHDVINFTLSHEVTKIQDGQGSLAGNSAPFPEHRYYGLQRCSIHMI